MTWQLAVVTLALAAGARSTWSPCGRSMLSSITPVSERARHHRYGATATWYLLGAVLGGACLGALGALMALLVARLGPHGSVAVGLAVVAAAVVLASDAGWLGPGLPIHRRQVNERWLDQFRPWVYGLGFGWQIGSGLATYIMTGAVYLVVVLSALSGSVGVALGAGVAFGVVRGSAVWLSRHLRTPADLAPFHRRLTAAEPRAHRALLGAEVGTLGLLVAFWWSPAAALGLAVGLAVALLPRRIPARTDLAERRP